MLEVTMILCWAIFTAVIGCMWLTGCGLDTANIWRSNNNYNKVVISRISAAMSYIIILIKKERDRGWKGQTERDTQQYLCESHTLWTAAQSADFKAAKAWAASEPLGLVKNSLMTFA